MKSRLAQLIGLAVSVAVLACSGADKNAGKDGAGGNSVGGASSGELPGGDVNANALAVFQKAADGRCSLVVREETCAAEAFETEVVPLDLYVMFDRSGSMCNCVDPVIVNGPCPDVNCRKTRIDAIREAMANFISDSGSAGIGLGIGYFGQQPIGAADCNPATYSNPSVGIDTLPANATSVMRSLNEANPIGETPTGGAIRGACAYAQSWKRHFPVNQTAILFVTDGEPKAPVSCPNGVGACCPTLDDAVSAAAACNSGDAAIRTYVLGIGPFLSNLDQIAKAGGTKAAYLVEGGDVAAQVLAALNAIRTDAAIPCEFQVTKAESGKVLDFSRIGIAYADSSCNTKVFSRVGSAESCGTSGGYYLDDPTAPSQVRLCPTSCDLVSAGTGQLFYSIGCGWESQIQ